MTRRLPEIVPRVRRAQIERFYRTCGEGLLDRDAIDDLGLSLYARGQCMLGNLSCPDCAAPLERRGAKCLVCAQCEWECPWSAIRETAAGRHLSPGRMRPHIAEFVRDFAAAKTLGDKVVLIDTLIHRFHEDLDGGNKPGAYNLIEGDVADIAAFLDRITYGEGTPEEVRRQRERWRDRVRIAPRFWSGQLAPDDG